MRSILLSIFTLSLLTSLFAQNQQFPEFNLQKSEVEAHLRFLASDELQGRRTGEKGNDVAAAYLAAQLAAYGVKRVAGANGYMQPVALEETQAVENASLTWNKNEFQQRKNLMILNGSANDLEAKAVFAKHGWIDENKGINDYEGLNVKGKIVVTNIGSPEDNSAMGVFTSMSQKRKWAQEQGAIGLIELFQLGKSFWGRATSYFARPRVQLTSPGQADADFVYGWLLEEETGFGVAIKEGKKKKVILSTDQPNSKKLLSDNVIGVIEGSDPQLKEEYILLSAHYDHVGTGKQGGGAFSAQDSIFNGARDNAMGTTAVLAAAKSLSMKPPKRSVIILAVTGEELGLLGSRYYAENPLIPLEKTIFNLNTDGAGYNNTEKVSIIGLGRTGIDEELKVAAKNFGLDLGDDPAPEQGLFDRSDNVSFAAKGVPAACFSPGMNSFDQSIMKYYHQVTDNPNTIDFDYLLSFCQSFTHAARLIADKDNRPKWVEGDKYEEAGQQLYDME
ncbi:MAG: M28 family peptidase [Bacteroidota bacterium]